LPYSAKEIPKDSHGYPGGTPDCSPGVAIQCQRNPRPFAWVPRRTPDPLSKHVDA